METQRSKQASVFILILVSGLFSQNFVIPVMSTTAFEDQKTYNTPPTGPHAPHAGIPPTDPHAGTPPTGTHYPPSHGPPTHGHGTPTINCVTPPYGGTPPYDPPTPYHDPPTPHHDPPTPHHDPPTPHHDPPTPHHDPPTPHHDPPTPHHDPPTPHHDPPTPHYNPPTPTGGGYYPSPPTGGHGTPPVTISPPTIPIDPGTPTVPTPGIPGVPGFPGIPSSPPFVFDPHTPFTGTCYFWSSHPAAIWALLGWLGTLGGTFGTTSLPGSTPPTLSLPQALSNTRTDGYGALYREGTASLLNSMVNHQFPYTTTHVRNSFTAALGSNKAASAQAQLFKMANEGRLKPRA